MTSSFRARFIGTLGGAITDWGPCACGGIPQTFDSGRRAGVHPAIGELVADRLTGGQLIFSLGGTIDPAIGEVFAEWLTLG
mmetsp:Transcript_5367/g.10787  ORF Transcript_5367/g.10787 Transcript_5367/m.10787 type:complete len:81 (+) Transcript_5367:110-352(+)